MSRHLLDTLWDSLPTDVASSVHEQFRVIRMELTLLRRGIMLAEKREKSPSYIMELKALLETVDAIL